MTDGPVLKALPGSSQRARCAQDHPLQGPRTLMLPIDLETRADVVIIPRQPGGAATLPCRDVSVASAFRYVVEEPSGKGRPRAVVPTATASLFSYQIEAL